MPLERFSQWTVQAEYQKSYYLLQWFSKAFLKVRDVSSFLFSIITIIIIIITIY